MPRSGDGGGDRRIRCEGHRPPPLPAASGKRDRRSVGTTTTTPQSTTTTTTTTTMPGRGGEEEGFIACCDATAYAGAKSTRSWEDDGDRTRRRTTAMRLLDRMGGLTTMPSLLLRGIEDHDGGLSLSSLSSLNSL